jgi:hypothetical protein
MIITPRTTAPITIPAVAIPEPVLVPWLRLMSLFATAPKIIARMLPRSGQQVKPSMPNISEATAHPLDFLPTGRCP